MNFTANDRPSKGTKTIYDSSREVPISHAFATCDGEGEYETAVFV